MLGKEDKEEFEALKKSLNEKITEAFKLVDTLGIRSAELNTPFTGAKKLVTRLHNLVHEVEETWLNSGPC